jgi:hypothetical protein
MTGIRGAGIGLDFDGPTVNIPGSTSPTIRRPIVGAAQTMTEYR